MRFNHLLTVLLLVFVTANQAQVDWQQTTGQGLDISASHTGQQWFIGADGKAYKWESERWVHTGGPGNFERVDAGEVITAAITQSGKLYFYEGNAWKNTGLVADDVGIGGGKIWLAGARNSSGAKVTIYGDVTQFPKIEWHPIRGTLERLDVDPQGQPWGLDNQGALYVYANDGWIEDTKAPKASDIGIGGDGSLYVVSAEQNSELGGGQVYLRNAQTGEWRTVPGRLTAISAMPDGKAFGVNSLNWLMAGTAEGSAIDGEAGNLPDDTSLTGKGTGTLADIVGTTVPGADKVVLTEYKITADTISGTAELNGAKVKALLHQPDPKVLQVIAGLEHDAIDLGTYIPKIRNTGLGSFGLANAVFYMQPEDAEKIEYGSYEEMPVPLAQLLTKQQNFSGLFPLTIHPGVTVIGTYDPNNKNAQAVMSAYGMNEAGYTVKGHFKLSQLQNLSFDIPNVSLPPGESKKQHACEKSSSAALSGLDLSFPIPDFKPPYAKSAIAFSNSEFSLKEIDGQIEPAIVTGMTLTLPEATIGIKNVPMAGKLAVRGDLNVLCTGIDKQTEGVVTIAAATTFNADIVGDQAIKALSKVTEQGTDSPEGEGLGWKEAFGLPFLNIRQYAVSGEFEQKTEGGELKVTLATTIWSDSVIDRAKLDMFGTVNYEIKPNTLAVTDWSFNLPGPVAMNDLPGLKDMPKVDEFALKDIDLTPTEMTGSVLRQSQDIQATAYLQREQKQDEPDQYDLYVQFTHLTPSAIYDFLPQQATDVTVSPALITWSNQPTKTVQVAEAADKLKPLLAGLVGNDGEITVGKGLTLVGRTTPASLFKGRFTNLFTDYVTVKDGIRLFGVFAKNDANKMNGELRAMLDSFSVKAIPESTISFSDSEIVLANIDGSSIEIETKANMQALANGPIFDLEGNTTLLALGGSLRYEQTSATQNQLNIEVSSDYVWNNPFKIPEFQVSNLGLEAEFSKNGDKTSQQISLVGDGVLREQTGKVSVDFAASNGAPEFAAVTFEGNLTVSQLLSLPEGTGAIADATLNTIVLSTNAVAGDLSFNLNKFAFNGRGAVIFDDEGAALFLRHDQELAIGKMVDDIPAPFVDVSIPKGVLIISPKDIANFDAGEIPSEIYDVVLQGLIDDELASKLKVDDGLTFMTKVLPSKLPSPIPAMLETPFGIAKDKEVYIAGSVGGMFANEAPSLGFYTVLKDFTPIVPPPIDSFIAPTKSNVSVFAKTSQGESAGVDVGISVGAKIKPRRLDDPTVVQALDGTFDLTYSAQAQARSVSVSANITGTWNDPMGLEGYSFVNPSFAFGLEDKGVTVGVHTDRADFSQGGTNKAFVFDLDTTWAGSVPTDLAVQFAKTKDTDELILTPIDMARVQKSIFDLAFRSGSKLKDGVLEAIKHAPTFGHTATEQVKANAPTLINGFSTLLENANDGMFSLLENSPMSMVGIRNPQVYFGTPGSTPPNNPDIDRPPLGLGLVTKGQLIIDTNDMKVNVAGGDYKINLRDGYYIRGYVTPPSPFNSNRISIAGNMPFLGGAQFLRFNGKLEVPGVEFAGISLGVEGNFDVSRGSLTSNTAKVAADVSIGGVLSRQGTMDLNGTSLSFNSPGGCTDIPPLDISGTLTLTGFEADDMAEALLGSFKPSVPNPVECAGDLFGKFKDIAEGTVDIVTNPIDSAESIGEGTIDLLSNPEETFKKAGKIGQAPLDAGEALAGMGIGVAQMGLEKVPVLGPGAGQMLGSAFEQASKLKAAAMNALKNNAVTGFMADAFGAAAGAVMGAAGDVANAVVSAFKKNDTKTWYRENPLRCETGNHYWNDVFMRCFEHDAIVLFDEASRADGQLGDCMKTRYVTNNNVSQYVRDAVAVEACGGHGANQFHLNSSTQQIRAVRRVYYGYDGRFYGPSYDGCLTRRDNGEVFIQGCHLTETQQWVYTDEMKLQNGDQCIARNAQNRLEMASCDTATSWLGTAVAPDWNKVEQVPMRGQITHQQTGRCLNWYGGGPHRLMACGTAPGLPEDLRTHVRLRVLDGDNTVSIMGSRAWDREIKYGCAGLTDPDSDNVMARHCWPDNVYQEAKWKVWPVINQQIDRSGSLALVDVLNHHPYVFENVQSDKCLTATMTPTQIADQNYQPWLNKVTHCSDGTGLANAGVQFRHYTPDSLSAEVIANAAEKVQRDWEASRMALLPVLKDWQKYRIRSENARITEVRKMASTFNSTIKGIQRDRQSPGHCKVGEFWNQTLKECAEGSRMVLKYHNSAGDYLGCLQRPDTSYYHSKLQTNPCLTANQHRAVVNSYAFMIDEQGHIIKKNANYTANIQAGGTSNTGNTLYYDVGDIETRQDDTCLDIQGSVTKHQIDGKTPIGFSACRANSMKWAYSSQGELVSENGQCLRHKPYQKVGGYINGTYDKTLIQHFDTFILEDCSVDPMQTGKYRWIPTLGYNFTAEQALPSTAKLKLADTNQCITSNLFINGELSLARCSSDNVDQYMAFGGTDKTRFLISPRNSKTCLFDAGQDTVSHRPCRGSGAEMFMQIDQGNDQIKIQNALSGQCLDMADDNSLVQTACAQAPVFELEVVDSIEGIEFAAEGLLQPDQQRTEQAQGIWNTAKKRAEYLYLGAYLSSGNNMLQKDVQDRPQMRPNNATVTLKALPAFPSKDIPAVTVPKTQILTLPGFVDGVNHITFAHARPAAFNDGKPSRDHTSNPYAADFTDWFNWVHQQKVLRVMDDGILLFDYIDESDEFRASATFKVTAAPQGENQYAFESVQRPGHYLQVIDGVLALASNKTYLTYESTAQWFKSDNLNFYDFQPPFREPKPPFEHWIFPEDGWVLTH